MIFGLPWLSWVLLDLAVLPGLLLVAIFYWRHRRKGRES